MSEMIDQYTSSAVGPNSRLSLDGRRGYMSGGSLRVRFENRGAPELYNIQLPSFRADCNGMDMHLGSLSWISADEFMNAARQMASPSVLIYALSLALNQMCGPCAQIMESLQDELNKYSSMLKQSCEQLGTALFEKSGMREKAGELQDRWWGQAQSDSGMDAAAVAGRSVQLLIDSGRANEISGNTVWQHLDQITVGGWLASVAGENVAKQMIMSMSGTVIINADGATDESDIIYDPRNPVAISLTNIVKGGEVMGLRCMDNFDHCLDVQEAVLFDMEPLNEQFFAMLDPSETDSIPTRFGVHVDGRGLEPEQEAFLLAAQRHIDLVRYLHNLAVRGQEIPTRIAAFIAEWMAIEVALEFMLSYVDTANSAFSQIDNKADLQEINPFYLKSLYRQEADSLRAELAEEISADANISTVLRNSFGYGR